MHAIDLLGATASALSFVLWLPQGWRVWTSRNHPARLGGLPIGTQLLLLAETVLWAVYAIPLHAFWVAAPVVVNAPLALGTIAIILRGRRLDPADGAPAPMMAPVSPT